jgi:hypothetical protein
MSRIRKCRQGDIGDSADMYNTDLNLALHFVHYVDGGAEVIHLLYVLRTPYKLSRIYNL